MHLTRYARGVVVAAALLAAAAPAAAQGRHRSADSHDLPGVKGGYSIVTEPQPAPEPDTALPADNGGWIRIGDHTEIRISGSVSYQIGFSSVRHK